MKLMYEQEEGQEEQSQQSLIVTNYANILKNMDHVEGIHESGTTFLSYFLLVIPDVVGRLRYKRFWNGRRERQYQDLVTVADEGFGLLVLENNMEKWSAEVEAAYKHGVKVPDSMFTPHAKKKDREPNVLMPARKEGWSKKGLKRYNLLCKHILEVRKDKTKVNELNNCLLERMKEDMKDKKGGKDTSEMGKSGYDDSDESDTEQEIYSGSIELYGESKRKPMM